MKPGLDQTGPEKNETWTGGENPDRFFFQTWTGPNRKNHNPDRRGLPGPEKIKLGPGPDRPGTSLLLGPKLIKLDAQTSKGDQVRRS